MKLIDTNKYLSTPEQRAAAVLTNVATSSAIEGIKIESPRGDTNLGNKGQFRVPEHKAESP